MPGSDQNPTPKSNVQPGAEAEIDLRFNSGIPPTDGYCKVTVTGAHERNDVRVDLQVYWTKPVIPGTTTPIIQLARTVQGYESVGMSAPVGGVERHGLASASKPGISAVQKSGYHNALV